MLIKTIDVQEWADILNTDALTIKSKVQILLAQIAQLEQEKAQLELELSQLQEQLADVPTKEAAQQIIQPALDNIHENTL